MNELNPNESYSFEIPPNGDLSLRTDKELRGMLHTNRTPTGLYVTQDRELSVMTDSEGLLISIGQWGAYANLNNGEDVGFYESRLEKGENVIKIPFEIGMIYFVNRSEDEVVTVNIEGALQAPVFYLDKTKQSEWLAQLDNLPDAPFGELIGEHVFATYQYEILNTPQSRLLTINNALKNWDEVYKLHNALHGLVEEGTGVARKYSNRMHFITPDDGAGYAYAGSYRISYQKNTGAAVEVLEASAREQNPGTWTVFHEAGHTYVNPLYKPGYLGEVTLNIYSNHAQEKLGLGSRYDGADSERQAMYEYLNSTEDDKNFANPQPPKNSPLYPFDNDRKHWVWLGMYLQLYYGYGEHFYSHLNQQYRILINQNITDDDAKLQNFILYTSLVSGRNLTSFFTRWGIYPDESIVQKIKHLPEPSAPIWENITSDSVIVDEQLPAYQPPSAKVIPGDYILGSSLNDNDVSKFFSDLEVAEPPCTISWIADDNMADDTSLGIIIKDTKGNQNKFNIPINFLYGDAISIFAYARSVERLILKLNPENSTFVMYNDKYDRSQLDSGNGLFLQLNCYSSGGNKIHSWSVNKEDDGLDFSSLVTGNSYENGYVIAAKFYADKHVAAYKNSQLILSQEDAGELACFLIENDQFTFLNAEDIKPKAVAVPTSTDIGVSVPPEKLVRDVKVFFGTESVIDFVRETNIYVPGKRDVEVSIKDELNNETRIIVELTVNYNTSISLTGYLSEERAVLRVNSDKMIVEAFSNPLLSSIIIGGSGKYYEIVHYNVDLEEKNRFSVNRDETPFEFVNAINGIAFEDEDYLHIYVADSRKITAYVMNNQLFPRDESMNDEWFIIAYGELIRVPSPLGTPTRFLSGPPSLL